ncbi:hypothetical protein [Halolamina salifodinae]|uniref:Uncharacterized protein n=1 Tax=Halolamina salifodinae TaxID=1202767 RepID=A0A8T4GWG8_9EURY|nr:hypothetical protein [Halolamina salifodinae]MBP1986024.1 hypothetical protein [Halolamina salifodinae]
MKQVPGELDLQDGKPLQIDGESKRVLCTAKIPDWADRYHIQFAQNGCNVVLGNQPEDGVRITDDDNELIVTGPVSEFKFNAIISRKSSDGVTYDLTVKDTQHGYQIDQFKVKIADLSS